MKQTTDEPKSNNKIITNPVDKDGNCLCPVCKKGAIWSESSDAGTGKPKYMTSPMRRFRIPGKVDALMHECCIAKILSEARVKK